jgi:Holliday junction resolvase
MLRTPEFKWLFGGILGQRLKLEAGNRDVHWSRLVRLFYSDTKVERTWAEHIGAYRAALVNPEDAPTKAASDLVVTAADFDSELLDGLSEWMACVKLRPLGFDSFRVIAPPAGARKQLATPDFLAARNGQTSAIEVKNLRAHECVEAVMPNVFYDEQLKGAPLDGVRLVVLRSFRGTLNSDETTRLRDIVRNLPVYPLNKVCSERLSARAEAVFRVIPGGGTAMCQDFIGLDDLGRDVDAYAGLLNKIADNARQALKQLHSPAANSASTRVVAMRWDIPFVSMPWPARLTDAVLDVFMSAQREVGLSAQLHIFTDYDYVLASTL